MPVPNVLGAGTAIGADAVVDARLVQGVADGSVPNQFVRLRLTIFSGRYWFGRELP